MSLYGLDIIKDREGNYLLTEINGVNSGMRGFQQIYRDNRVREQVIRKLEKVYGTITLNDGSYKIAERNKSRKNFIISKIYYLLYKAIKKNKRLNRWLLSPNVLESSKAQIEWLQEHIEDKVTDLRDFHPFEIYNGQDSTVLNVINEELPHPLVNPFVVEEITRNKFLQYLVLRNTEVKGYLPRSTLVDLGATHESELEEILKMSDSFVLKPILGFQGRGFKYLTGEEAEQYRNTRGSVCDLEFFDKLVNYIDRDRAKRKIFIEDMIDDADFSFEVGMSIIQPFIDSEKIRNDEKVYSVIRAIVCNGSFIDAYQRVSNNKRVNLTQGAKAEPLDRVEKEEIKFLSEFIINIFEKECEVYEQQSFKNILYNLYIESRGRTSIEERLLAMANVIIGKEIGKTGPVMKQNLEEERPLFGI